MRKKNCENNKNSVIDILTKTQPWQVASIVGTVQFNPKKENDFNYSDGKKILAILADKNC